MTSIPGHILQRSIHNVNVKKNQFSALHSSIFLWSFTQSDMQMAEIQGRFYQHVRLLGLSLRPTGFPGH
jgi:hypothetical protein